MPGQFTDKNGANLAGHSDKWSDKNRRPNSHQAGQGSRGSRNQGTGAAGRANTVATDTVDTSKMSKEEKMKYFNSLGLLTPQQKQAQAEPKPEPVQQAAPQPAANPIKELSDKLGKIFAQKPQLIQGIVQKLQSIPKEQLKDKAQAVLNSMQGNVSTEPTEVFSTIMKALEDQPAAEPERSAPKDRTARMTEDEFRSTNEYLGDKFVQQMIDQANQFEESDKALFMIDMAIENVDDVNDVRSVRHSMSSVADDLGALGFEPKESAEETKQEDSRPEEGSIEWIRMIHKYAFDNGRFQKPFDSYDSYEELTKNNHDYRIFYDYMEKIERNPKTKPLYDLAMHKLNDFDPEEGEESNFINIGDAIFSIIKDGENVQRSSGTTGSEGTQSNKEQELSAGNKHFVSTNKDAFAQPSVEEGLKVFRNRGHQEDLNEVLKWFADLMKQQGIKPAAINKTLAHYNNELKDNYYKFVEARNSMTDNAEAYDPEYGSEIEHYLTSFENGMENYDRSGMSEHEKQFIELYKYLK